MKKVKESSNSSIFKFISLFSNKYTYIGIIIILISVIINFIPSICELNFDWLFVIIGNTLSTVGTALVIGAIFDLAKNSQQFILSVSKILSDIVVSKAFLNQLTGKDKRQALEIILQPSGNQLQQYSNINTYFHKKIDESTSLFNTNFKSNLNLNVVVYKNTESDLIESKSILRYRVYKINNNFLPIHTWLEAPKSEIVSIKIIYGNNILTIGQSDIHTNDDETNTKIPYKKSFFEIPEQFQDFPYITVQYEIIEIGFDHWTNYHWTSLTPYDGIDFSLRVEDNLKIKEHFLFDDGNSYNVDINENKNCISIISTAWLNSFTGLTVTVGEDDASI